MFSDSPTKDYTGQILGHLPASEFNNLTLQGYCFSQETPDTKVFPDDMTGVTFLGCNLDNCLLPDGNTVIGGSQRRFKVQGDGFDWLIDEQDQPVSKL